MASAQPAYRYDYARRGMAQPAGPSIHVVPGGRNRNQASGVGIAQIARIAIAVIVAIAILGAVRIGLASATLMASYETTDLRISIDQSVEAGKDLEVKATQLSDSAYLKGYGKKKLKMSAPGYVENIVLPADVVATDSAGNLSLSQSLSVVASK